MLSLNENKKRLIERYVNDQASEKELQAFFGLLGNGELEENIEALMELDILSIQKNHELNKKQQDKWKEELAIKEQEIKKEQIIKKPVRIWPGVVAAAAVTAITLGVWLYYTPRPIVNRNSDHEVTAKQNRQYDISPGKHTATLTLANGRKIVLSDAINGKLAEEAGVTISKSDNGQVVYIIANAKQTASAKYNTLSTTKGETYQIILPDGSKVWLNAASSLKYPASFSGLANRRVELLGEAYFEIFHNKTQPFVVNSKKMELTVLGTHFNVNAYNDESSTKATLLEGSVRLRSLNDGRNLNLPGDNVILKPNQQAIVTENSEIKVKPVDINEAIAWKNGLFAFTKTPLFVVMKQIERWYNVEVIYKDINSETERFTGTVSKYDKVSGILSAIEKTGAVKFKIEGRRVYVQK